MARDSFGIEMSMELFGVSERQGRRYGKKMEKLLQEYEAAFSLYQSSSELSRLNECRKLAKVSPLFDRLLKEAIWLHKATFAYFDPAVHGAYQKLENGVSEDLFAGVNLTHLQPYEKGWRLTHPKTELSLNAIVQGAFADAIGMYLMNEGVKHALLHLGETVAIGGHPEGRPWKLAVQGNAVEGEVDLIGTVAFQSAGLAVSSHDSSRRLLDPVAKNFSRSNRVVAVVAPTAPIADAFATAFAVAPREKWGELHGSLKKLGPCKVKLWVNHKIQQW